MNLRWNGTLRCFEAEFSSDFQGDLAAVKAAGFKTDGPPQWVWYTAKAGPLNKLREARPASGLTINPDAKQQFAVLYEVELSNAKVKAELATHTKVLKKKLRVEEEQVTHAVHIPPKGYIDATDLPPYTPPASTLPKPIPLVGPACIICGDILAFYEKLACLWCSKIVLDNCSEVC
jgi:hypothetical protein